MLDPEAIDVLAARLLHAQDHAHTIDKLTDDYPAMDVADAYAVQDALCRRWLARGDDRVGMKAGLTSKAKMQQMGVHVPSFGLLMASFARADGETLAMRELVHPRVEPELAFVTARELAGDVTIGDVLDATAYVVAALEVIDSRYERFKFDLVSAIADNGSSARFVTGTRHLPPRAINLATVGVQVERNGETAASGVSAAVLDHPAQAIVMLVAHLAARGTSLPAGSFVMTGGITEAIAVTAGDQVVARFEHFGDVSVRFA